MPELLQDWVTAQAERRPGAPAVVGGDGSLTYAQLERLSNRLARALEAGGCGTGDRVCLLMPKSPAAIACALGIYKAGCVYVPLDPRSPPARLARLLDACESRWVLASSPCAGALDQVLAGEQLRGTRVGWMDPLPPQGAAHFAPAFTLRDLRRHAASPPERRGTREDPAHILFTSGSTGSPKGVVITHSGVIHFVQWAVEHFGMGASDRVSGHPPLHFDLSVFDIFGTFAAGAQLHLVAPELSLLPNKLAEFIRDRALTQWFSVPSLLAYLARFDVVRFNDFKALKRLLWCGEVFPTPALVYWMRRLPHVTFTNLYGPTEATIASSYYTVPRCPDDEEARIPIGTACPGEELLVLDDRLEPVAPGEVGDLYIRGVGLSPGYWKDPEKTRSAFLPGPRGAGPQDRIYRTGDLGMVGDDGLVYFAGRADTQVKSRGHRIELGEIEAALNALDCVAECAVLAVEDGGFGSVAICCAYVGAGGEEVTPPRLRRELSATLPGYMVPVRWMSLQELPRNANDKVDRNRLAARFRSREAQAT